MAFLSHDTIAALMAGLPKNLDTVDTGTSVAYSERVLYPGKLYRIVSNDAHEWLPVREYVYGSYLGDDEYDEPAADVFESDVAGSNLSTNFWQRDVTTNEAVLDNDGTPNLLKVYGERGIRFGLDDQDDVFRCFLNVRKIANRTPALYIPRDIKKEQALQFSVSHIESDNTKPMQYQLRAEIGGAQVYWNGSTWTTESWIDITGSATVATFTDAVTTHSTTNVPYTLAFRSKADAALDYSWIAWFGLHETLTAGQGTRQAANTPDFFTPRWRCRIASIADNATKKLYIAEMQP